MTVTSVGALLMITGIVLAVLLGLHKIPNANFSISNLNFPGLIGVCCAIPVSFFSGQVIFMCGAGSIHIHRMKALTTAPNPPPAPTPELTISQTPTDPAPHPTADDL